MRACRRVDLVDDRLDAPAEHEVGPRPVGRDQPDQIARTGLALEEVPQILAHRLPALQVEDRAIDDEDHDAIVGVGRELETLAGGQHRPAGVVGLAEGDELGRRDRLGLAVFEDLEVVFREVGKDLAAERRIGVDPDVVRAGAEHRRALRWLRRLSRDARRARHSDHKGHKDHEAKQALRDLRDLYAAAVARFSAHR